jgi:predicted acyltransferase
MQTYVPLQLGTTVVVAEMSQPFAPIAADAWTPWYVLAFALGVALLATTILWVLAQRPAAPRRPA